MEQYIDKSALVAEIEKKIKQYEKAFDSPTFASYEASLIAKGKYRNLLDILQFINTLEVKVTDEVKIGETQIYLEDDGGEPPYDGIQWLDLSCTEYEIPKDFKNGDNVEILIRKAQKGE